MTRLSFHLIFWRDIMLWSLSKVVYFGASFLFLTVLYSSLNFMRTLCLTWLLTHLLLLNTWLISNCQPTKNDTVASGYCCLVLGMFLYWLAIGLIILIVSLKKIIFLSHWLFFSACCKNQMKLCVWKHLVNCKLSM